MKILKYIFFLLLISGCMKKELPPDLEGQVQFYVKGELTTIPWKMEAGIEGVKYSTERTSASSSVKYINIFQNSTSAEALKITFFDQQDQIINNSLPMQLSFNSSAGGAVYQFKAQPQGQGPYTYYWDFGDGNTSNLKEPQHKYPTTGNYPVKLKIDYSNGCADSFENNINTANQSCGGIFSFMTNPGSNVVQFEAEAFDTVGAVYSWDFGDGTGGSGKTVLHQYNSFTLFRVCLTISKGTCSTTYCQQIALNMTNCLTNFTYSISSGSNSSAVMIEYTDPAGIKYISDPSLQPSFSEFNILEKESYHLDGKNYRKLRINAKCRLFKENDPQIYKDLNISEGVIAIEQ